MTPEEHYEIYKAKSKLRIRFEIAKMLNNISEAEIAQLVFEDMQIEEREQFEKELIKQQHDLNKENIRIQNEFNENIFKKQKRLTIFVLIINSFIILIASLSAVYLGYILQQGSKSENKDNTGIHSTVSQTKNKTLDLPHAQIPDKVP